MSINSVAYELGISRDVLTRKLTEQGHDFKMIRRSGLESLQRRMYKLVNAQITEKDEFDAGMKYLTRYQRLEEDEGTETKPTIESDIRLEIINELSSGN